MVTYLNDHPEIYLTNKFTHCYFYMIHKIKKQNRRKPTGGKVGSQYLENHHIIPKAIGGNNSKSNLVLLTAFEHMNLHWLLTSMGKSEYHKQKLLFPLSRFLNEKRTAHLSQNELQKMALLYEQRREEIHVSWGDARRGNKNGMYGRVFTDAERKQRSDQAKGRKLTDAHKKRISEFHKGNTYRRGKILSVETREAISKTALTNKRHNKIYEVTTPNGEVLITNDRKHFCEEHNINSTTFGIAAHRIEPYKGYKVICLSDNANDRDKILEETKERKRIRYERDKAIRQIEIAERKERNGGKLKTGPRHTYEITMPSGEIIVTDDKLKFCNEHNLKPFQFAYAISQPQGSKGYNITRTKVIKNPKI